MSLKTISDSKAPLPLTESNRCTRTASSTECQQTAINYWKYADKKIHMQKSKLGQEVKDALYWFTYIADFQYPSYQTIRYAPKKGMYRYITCQICQHFHVIFCFIGDSDTQPGHNMSSTGSNCQHVCILEDLDCRDLSPSCFVQHFWARAARL